MKLILSRVINQKGQTAAVLNLFIAAFMVAIIGVFAFELSRYFLAKDQLKATTEAAALCCETALVSSGDPTDATNQANAVNVAVALFQQNSILGQSMANASSQTAVTDLNPAPGQAEICFVFLNPVTRAPIVIQQGGGGTPASGALINCTAAYNYTPAFGKYLFGLGQAQFVFQVSAFSGVPRIDVVLAFDVSGAMDDQTPVSITQRSTGGDDGGGGGSTGGPTGGSTGGGGGGGGGGGNCITSKGTNYMLVNGINNQTVYGDTIAGIFGHPGGVNTSLVNANFPQALENSASIPGAPIFAEQPAAATNDLTGYSSVTGQPGYVNVAAGDYCPCPVVGYLDNIASKPSPSSKVVHPKDSELIALTKSDANEDLLNLCGQLNLCSAGKKIKTQFKFGQLDDKLAKVYFRPLFAACPTVGGNPSQTAVASNQAAQMAMSNAGGGGSQMVSYIDPQNNQYYFATSHAPGGGLPPYTIPGIPGKCPGPGNTGPSPVPSGANTNTLFTDLVTNIDFSKVFYGNYTSSGGFLYTDPGVLAEAARFNLDSQGSATNAFVDYSGMNVFPTPGYAADYYANVQLALEPLNDLLYAAASLVEEMSNVADAHFSFIAFSDTAGNANTGITPAQYSDTQQAGYLPMISSWFPYPAPAPTLSGFATFILPPLPFVALDPNNSNSDLISTLPDIKPYGNRNVAAVLQAAINQLNNNGRPGANKAIILFCDGVPTEANQGSAGALADAISAIQNANTQIPIYCVCVSDPDSTATPVDDIADDAAYGDNNGGLTALSAPSASNGHKYYRVDYVNPPKTQGDLSTVVDNIVRQMVGMMN